MTMKLNRFIYVRSSRGRVRHILIGPKVEGEKVLCGIRQHVGWRWMRPSAERHLIPVCPRCMNAEPRGPVRRVIAKSARIHARAHAPS